MSKDQELFAEELREYFEILSSGLIRIEGESGDALTHTVAELFRAAHNVKGMSAMEGQAGMAELAHAMEESFVSYRDHGGHPIPEEVDAFLEAVDSLDLMLTSWVAGSEPESPSRLLARLRLMVRQTPQGETPATSETDAETRHPDESRVESTMLEIRLASDCALPSARAAVVLRAIRDFGDILSANPSLSQIEAGEALHFTVAVRGPLDALALVNTISEISDVAGSDLVSAPAPTPPVAESGPRLTARIEVGRLDNLMDMVSELVVQRGQLDEWARQGDDRQLTSLVSSIDRSVSDLYATVSELRMVGLEGTFQRMRRLVRDTARELGKAVAFETSGEDTELDRSVVEQITEPLVHLLRNAVDHGLEPPEERVRAGKNPEGQIGLHASYEGNQVVISVTDDGRGIDPDAVAAKAIALGLVDDEDAEASSHQKMLDAIFAPGFSTQLETGLISGRGVGLDIVRSQASRSGGMVEVQTTLGAATTFRIRLPLSLAVLESLLVKISGEVYAMPLSEIEETLFLGDGDLWSVQGAPMVDLRGEVASVLHGRQRLGSEMPGEPPHQAVVFRHYGRPYVLTVDELVGRAEVVVKPVPNRLAGVRHVSGVTILGDGTVGLIVDVPSLATDLSPGDVKSTPATV